jgi:hypothetical protein
MSENCIQVLHHQEPESRKPYTRILFCLGFHREPRLRIATFLRRISDTRADCCLCEETAQIRIEVQQNTLVADHAAQAYTASLSAN